MTKLKTLLSIETTLNEIAESGLSITEFFRRKGESPKTFYNQMSNLKQNGPLQNNNPEFKEKYESVLLKYDQIKSRNRSEQSLDNEPKVETKYIRDDEGKITGYSFVVYRRNNSPVTGILTRDEMNSIYRLYSYYGSGITQRQISRFFPEYSLMDFKRILRAFNITKASSPFAPHMYEEHTEEELKEIHAREKENDFLKRIEKDEINDLRQTAIKFAKKNRDLEQTIDTLSQEIKISVEGNVISTKQEGTSSDKSMIVYLSDMHIGAKCNSDTLYPNPYDKKEISRRLTELASNIASFGHLNELVICLMGDSLDGMDQQTARRDHIMPQCMDNNEQLTAFIDLTFNFITTCRSLCNKITIYSVKCGNHGGTWEYTANLALKNLVERVYPEIQFTLFTEFIGSFSFKNHLMLITHGKDEQFMKRPLPLYLDDTTKVRIHEWLLSRNLSSEENIHVVKGDLHSNALCSCLAFDYRNVLSLFGASDYANYNFSRNSYGVSYDLFVGNNRTIGTFENFQYIFNYIIYKHYD